MGQEPGKEGTEIGKYRQIVCNRDSVPLCEAVCLLLQAHLPICPEFASPLLGFDQSRIVCMLSFSTKAHCVLYFVLLVEDKDWNNNDQK